jgi:hypothetical protein
MAALDLSKIKRPPGGVIKRITPGQKTMLPNPKVGHVIGG